MDEFDRSLTAAFQGTGKQRTLLSGIFLATVDKLFQSQGYRAVTAWQEDDTIMVCVEYPEPDGGAWQSMMGIDAAAVTADLQQAAVGFVEGYIDNDLNPPSVAWWGDMWEHLVSVCETKAPDAVPVLKETYGKYWEAAAVEVGYYHEQGKVEPNFMYLQDVQTVNGALIYIYKPLRRRWRMGDPVQRPVVPFVEHVPPPGSPAKPQ